MQNDKFKESIWCEFCEILENQSDKIIYTDDLIFAFYDIKKATAKEHILVCPKKHIPTINDLTKIDINLLEKMKQIGIDLISKIDSDAKNRLGFHIPPNNSIEHLHLHCFLLPFKNSFYDLVIYGTMLRNIDDQIDLLKYKDAL